MSMHSARSTVITAAALTFGVIFGVGHSPASAASRQLQYSSYAPPSHIINAEGIVPFIKGVAADTGDDLLIELRPGGVLSNAKTTLSAVGAGSVDGGFVVGVYTPKELLLNNALSNLGLISSDPRVLTGAINEMALVDCEKCIEEWRSRGVVAMGAISTTPYRLLCNRKISELSDLHGRKVRASPNSVSLAIALGMTAINVASTEIYEALERNQVDCTFGSPAHLANYSLWDVVKGVTDLYVGSTYGHQMLTFNAKVWDSLPAEHRNAIKKNAPRGIRGVIEGYMKDDVLMKEEAEKRGIAWIEPSKEMVKIVALHKDREVQQVISLAKSRGAADAESHVRLFQAKIQKWTELVSRNDYSWADFEADLAKHVYSRMRY